MTLSKVILTWNNFIEVVITDRPFKTVENGSSRVAWIVDVDRHNYPTPHPFTSIEVVRIFPETLH